jgi:hypothetical protein
MSRQQRRARERAARKAIAASALLVAGSASAATFPVSNLNDAGPGTLRQAVADANAAAGADTIVFQAGLSGTITLTSGEIPINDDLTINGPGSGVLSVSGNNASRIFNVTPPALAFRTVAINNLAVRNGNALAGGGILAGINTRLSLDRVLVTGNTAQQDGGGVGSYGHLSITNSTITGNTALRNGGGVASGPVYLSYDTISGNHGGVLGGGVHVFTAIGDLLPLPTTNAPLVTLRHTVVSNNTAGEQTGNVGEGGGAYIQFNPDEYSSLTQNTTIAAISDSVIANNVAEPNDAAGAPLAGTNANDHGRGGGLQLSIVGARVSVQRTTISGNTAAQGGGVAVLATSQATFENVTIANNVARSPIQAASGGGISGGYVMTIAEATITGNSATNGPGGIGSSAVLTNSIVANNTSTSGTSPDISSGTTANYTLIKTPGTATINGANNIIGQDPQLGALAANGSTVVAGAPGSTQTPLTERPAAASPAVNAGDPAFAPPPSTDERNMPRVAGGRIDMGAVEVQASTVQFAAASASVNENGGSITVSVARTGPDGAVSVNFATADGTALAGTDYTPQSGTLSWADGDIADKTITIPIVDDQLFEPSEIFSVALSAPSGGATLGVPATEAITIIDDDTAVVPTLSEWARLLLMFALAAFGALRLSSGGHE